MRERRNRRHHQGTDALLFVMVICLTGPFMQPLMAQQASRYAMTAAIVDHGTVAIDDYAHLLGADFAEREAHMYSDKAPGQPLLAVPAYALYRLLGGSPAAESTANYGDWGLWFVSFTTASLPAAVLVVLMRHLALRTGASTFTATGAAIVMLTGTMLLPFATQLFGHVLAGCLALAAWLCVTRNPFRRRDSALGGFLAASAVTVEYPVAIISVLVVIAAVLTDRHRWRWIALGSMVPAIALMTYHTRAFGHPLAVAYGFNQFESYQRGLYGIEIPSAGTTIAALVGERGLFSLTPLVLLATIATAVLAKTAFADLHLHAVTAAVVGLGSLACFIGLMGGWGNPYGGASPGPRYIVPALPWLTVGVAYAARHAPFFVAGVATISSVPMILATVTQPLAQPTQDVAIRWWISRLLEGRVADTVFLSTLGRYGVLLPLGAFITGAFLHQRMFASSRPRHRGITDGVPGGRALQ